MMFENYDQLMNFLQNLRNNDYQRDNFDKFLRKIKFSFDVPAIHIAGTNGKGSTGTILNNIYMAAGYKVGHYQSPYFVNPSETIRINNKGIELSYFNKILSTYQKEIKKYSLSQFEVETFVAFSYFKDMGCDIAIIECGMGGEIDATNVFTPIASIITSIGLEHTDFLGSTISEIALEKAGIIKEERPVIVGNVNNDALLVLAGVCRDLDAKLVQKDNFYNEKLIDNGYEFDFKPWSKLYINSMAYYSLENASTALTAIKELNDQFKVEESHVREGLKAFEMVGRLTEISHHPLIILDGAHNPEAMKALKNTMFKLSHPPVHIVFASFKDKNVDTMISDISVLQGNLTLTTFPHPRARGKDHYFLYLQDYPFEQDCFKAINDLIIKYPNEMILVTGSLAFVGYVYNHQDKIKLKGDESNE